MSSRGATLLVVFVAACTFDRSGVSGPNAAAEGGSELDQAVTLDRAVDRPGAVDCDLSPLDFLVDDIADAADQGPAVPWWDTSWTRRRKLTFLNTTGQEDLKGFPVLVALDSSRIDYSAADKDGKDLRFVDADHSTVLPHEIEGWQAGSTSQIWVRVPQIDKLSDSDHIWLYHGNPSAADGQQPGLVWAGDDVGVWHLNASYDDATTLANHATNHGASNTGGLVAGGQEFKGAQYIELPNVASLKLDALSVSLWFKSSQVWDDADWPGSATLVTRATSGWCSHDWTLFGGRKDTESGNTGRVVAGNGACTGTGWEPRFYSGTGQNDGVFHHLAYTRTAGGDNRLYLDGVEADALQDDGSSVAADRPIQVGGEQYHSGGSFLVGVIDELRIAKTARSAAWVDAEHRAGKDSLIDYGVEEQLTAP
jgi:hypothetical protein